MSQISPPIRIVLVGALALLAGWMLFLRPSTVAVEPVAQPPAPAADRPVEAGGVAAGSAAGQAVEAANDATAAADARVDRIERGDETAADARSAANAPPAVGAAPAAPATPTRQGTAAGDPAAAAAPPAGLPARIERALERRRVIALLLWNPRAADDRAVEQALSGIDRHRGKVVAHAADIKRISAYQEIARGANVDQSPTVLVIDRRRRVQSLVGYVDRVTIEQAVADALAAKRRP